MSCQVHDIYLGFKKALADHLGQDASERTKGDQEPLSDRVNNAFARAHTVKLECLLLKNFANKSKTIEAKKESITKYFKDHAAAARVELADWLHPAIHKEAKKVQASSAAAEPKESSAPKKAAAQKKAEKKKA